MIRQRRVAARTATARGLSLVEVIVALAVLTIGTLGLMASLLASVVHVRMSEARTIGTNHARDLLVSAALDQLGEAEGGA